MRLRNSILGAAALTLIAAPSLAQDSGGTLEEIVVTARKFGAERLQDVPITVTAITADTLRDMQVLDFEDFAYQVPGLTFLDSGPGQRRYVMRGIQSAGQQQVAVYYDEVPLPGVQSASSNSGSQNHRPEAFRYGARGGATWATGHHLWRQLAKRNDALHYGQAGP